MFSFFSRSASRSRTLRIKIGMKVKVAGSDRSPADPIRVVKVIAPSDIKSYSDVKQVTGNFAVEQFRIDFSKNYITLIAFFNDCLTEEVYFMRILGLYWNHWEWRSREVFMQNDRVLSKATVTNKKRNEVRTYFFDHTEFFLWPDSDFAMRLSKGFCNAVNTYYNSAITLKHADAASVQPSSNVQPMMPVTPQMLASIALERQELQAAARSGKTLSDEEKRKLALSEFVLGSVGEESVVTSQELSLEDAKDSPAVGEFTLGDVKTLLTAQGLSRGDVIRFLRNVQSGAVSMEEAHQFLTDCTEWEKIKHQTSMAREDFFAEKLAARERTRRTDPSHN